MIFTLLLALAQETQSLEITVDAGRHDRSNTPIRVPLASSNARSATVTDAGGRAIAAQVTGAPLLGGAARELVFVAPSLKAGETLSLKAAVSGAEPPRSDGFKWLDQAGDFAELSFGARPVLRYMYKPLDESSKPARDQTNKIFHHLYDPAGARLVTNGAGGRYPHHRGIFYGWNKVTYGSGKSCDIWHCPNAHQGHEKFLAREEGPVLGRHRLAVGWHGPAKELFAREERELAAYTLPGGTLVEFASRLTPVVAPIKLDGDPQHAGFHFRADNEVNDKTAKETIYVRPDGAGKPGETRNWPGQKAHADLPWDAMSFVLGGKRYTVAYLDHPQNPKEARFSERDYGRFGSYFEYTLEQGKTVEVRYRLWLQEGQMKPEEVAARSADFVDPPKVTVK